MNIGQIAKMAQQMQAQMAQAQEELREKTLEATAGGGAVRVVITGAQEVRTIEIDPGAVDPEEVEMLQDLILTAVNDAIARSKELERERTRNRSAKPLRDPEKVAALESLRLARTELDRQLAATTNERRRAQIAQAIEEINRRMEATENDAKS